MVLLVTLYHHQQQRNHTHQKCIGSHDRVVPSSNEIKKEHLCTSDDHRKNLMAWRRRGCFISSDGPCPSLGPWSDATSDQGYIIHLEPLLLDIIINV